MKRLIIATVVAVMFMTTVSAQKGKTAKQDMQQPTVEQMAQHRTDRMVEMLSLDSKQREQLYKLNLKTIKKQQAAKEKMSKLMEQAKDEAAQVRNEFDSSLKTILTSEQLQKYNEKKSNPQNRRSMMKRRPDSCKNATGQCCPSMNTSKCPCCARPNQNSCPKDTKGKSCDKHQKRHDSKPR